MNRPVPRLPDPGISERVARSTLPLWRYHRPAWLADDAEWERQLAAMSDEDVQLLNEQWELAGGTPLWFDDAPRYRPLVAWWARFKEGDSALWPLIWLVVGFVCIFGPLIAINPK